MAGKPTLYRIYRVTSPSGKMYVGLTKTTIWQRWRGHVKRARTGLNHPFYNAIRKYGEQAFTVEHIASTLGKTAAAALEMKCIADIPEGKKYNISPGGEVDGETASKVFWDAMRADPVKMEAYRAKLIEAQRVRVMTYEQRQRQLKGSRDWRAEHPKETWKQAHRASRMARKGAPLKERIDTRTLKEKLMQKHKGVFVRRAEGATKVWAARTPEAVIAISRKISESQKKLYGESTERREQVAAQLGKARAGMDRAHQAARASEGQKAYWVALRKDPERYAEYIARRRATFMATLERKKNENL